MKNVPVSVLLRNRGYFYFRPDYMTYQADTTLVPGGHISLRLIPLPGLPAAAQRSYYVGDASVYLFGKNGEAPNDSILYKNLNIHYYDNCSPSEYALSMDELSAVCTEQTDEGFQPYPSL